MIPNDVLQALAQDSSRGLWTDAAIRDTVADIARNPLYQRALTDSLWTKMIRWLIERINEIWGSLGGTQFGRVATITGLVLIVLIIGARIVIGINAERDVRAVRRRVRTAAEINMLAEAEKLAATGDYTGAAHALFAALLAASAARGELRLHPSKTTGDYARELRRKNASWLQSFQAFRARYDRVIYGDRAVSAGDYDALVLVARPVLAPERAA